MSDDAAPAPHDIFTDNQRWGDLDEWNRAALDPHERSGIERTERAGFGAHFCLDAELGRNELRRLFQHVIPRLESIELADDPTLMKTTFVGGHKTLPIRYELSQS